MSSLSLPAGFVRGLAALLVMITSGAALAENEENRMRNTVENLRADARHQFVMPKPVDQVFALFDPIAERDWVPGWDPDPVYPDELSLEDGSVFFLERDGRRETWTVLRHDPENHVADYLVNSPDYQQRWISVECSETPEGTLVAVRYRVTALSPDGAADLAKFDTDFIREWEAPVAKALGL